MSFINSVRKHNLTFFFMSIGISAALLVGSAFMIKPLFKSEQGIPGAAQTNCLGAAQAFGLVTEKKAAGVLRMNAPDPSKIEAGVYRAGAVIASCKGYEVADFCAGNGCAIPGVNFNLKAKTGF